MTVSFPKSYASRRALAGVALLALAGCATQSIAFPGASSLPVSGGIPQPSEVAQAPGPADPTPHMSLNPIPTTVPEPPAETATTPSPQTSTPLVTPTPTPTPTLTPGKPIYLEGSVGPEVRELQARLKQIGWMSGDVTDHFGPTTAKAVAGFQAKRGLPVTGAVDRATLDRLLAMTHDPEEWELTNQPKPELTRPPLELDARCLTGRAVCASKTARQMAWVVDGKVVKTFDVRFGGSKSPTREGQFSVGWKSRDHVSTIYHTAMPFAMFFSGGQAIHYSENFAAVGYDDASHGCINVRDRDGIAWLFDQVQVGDKVVVYR